MFRHLNPKKSGFLVKVFVNFGYYGLGLGYLKNLKQPKSNIKYPNNLGIFCVHFLLPNFKKDLEYDPYSKF